MTRWLLLGNDLNLNGILDPEENDGSGVLRPGLARYLTIYSRELNIDSLGQPRICVNDPDLSGVFKKLATCLGEEVAAFILAYRPLRAGQRLLRRRRRLHRPPHQGRHSRGQPESPAAGDWFTLRADWRRCGDSGRGRQDSRYIAVLCSARTRKHFARSCPCCWTVSRLRGNSNSPPRINITTAPREVPGGFARTDRGACGAAPGAG